MTVQRWLTAVMLVASMLAVAGPAQAAANKTLHISVGLAPATARVGSVAVVAGTVSSHETHLALLLQRLVSKHWVTIGHGKTTSGGHYAISVHAPSKAATWLLRITAAQAKSAAVHLRVVTKTFTVRASVALSVASGQPVVVTGSISPKGTGSVWLQSLQGRAWHNLVSVKLTKASTFRVSKTLTAGGYELRVTKAFSTTVARGQSKTLAVTVAAPVPTATPTPTPTPTRTTIPTATAALAVATAALPTATKGQPYTARLAASGGAAPYTWGVVGSLPTGFSLSAAGVLSGFPSATNASAVTVVVVDAAGASSTRALTFSIGESPAAGHTLQAWGENFKGALGNGSTSMTGSPPVAVSSLTGVVAAAGANGSGYGLLDDGTVWAWGKDNYDQLGDGKTADSDVPVQVVGVSDITAIAGNTFGGLAVRYDGTVWTWGVGTNGELGNGTNSTTSTAVQVTGLTNAVAVAGGGGSDYALRSDGTVWAWGEGEGGELGDGKDTSTNAPVQVSGLSDITAIAGGADSGYALAGNGTVWAWGDNGRGQLGDDTVTDRSAPVQVFGLTGVKAIAGNIWNGFALLSDGTVWDWGYSLDGEIGDGTGSTETDFPVQVKDLTGATAIAAGALNGYALLAGGTVSAWGYDGSGQLGDGGTTDSNVPVPVSGLSGVTSLGSGPIAYAAYAVM